MSDVAAEPSPPDGTFDASPLRCPRCDATLHDEQGWCLECGAPARTRLAPSPNWRIPAAIVAAAIILATAALAFAFVRLTDDQGVSPPTPPAPQDQPAPNSAPPAPDQPAPPVPPGQPAPAPAPGQPAPAPAPPTPPAPAQP